MVSQPEEETGVRHAARIALRIVRIIGGSALLFAAGIMGGNACTQSGASGGFGSFDSSRLFGGHALPFTLGAAAFLFIGVVVAKSGKRAASWFGVLLAIVGFCAAVCGVVGSMGRSQSPMVVYVAAAIGLVASIVMSLK